MTTSSAPILAFGPTAYGKSAARSSMIPSCAAIAWRPSTAMSPSGGDTGAATREMSDGHPPSICLVVVLVEPLLMKEGSLPNSRSV
jgi:hypothetical protein